MITPFPPGQTVTLNGMQMGSHTVWLHPALPIDKVTLSGKDGDDAERYQIRLVRRMLDKLGGTQ